MNAADYIRKLTDDELVGLRYSPNLEPDEERLETYCAGVLDGAIPDWQDRAAVAEEHGDVAAVSRLAEQIRDILVALIGALERSGEQPWAIVETTAQVVERRRANPHEWLQVHTFVDSVRRVDEMNRTDRRRLGRVARARGAGRPAGRRSAARSSAASSGDDGGGSDPPGPGLGPEPTVGAGHAVSIRDLRADRVLRSITRKGGATVAELRQREDLAHWTLPALRIAVGDLVVARRVTVDTQQRIHLATDRQAA